MLYGSILRNASHKVKHIVSSKRFWVVTLGLYKGLVDHFPFPLSPVQWMLYGVEFLYYTLVCHVNKKIYYQYYVWFKGNGALNGRKIQIPFHF